MPQSLLRRLAKPTTMLLATLAVLAAPYQPDATADETRKPRVDLLGDSLPDGALVRIGSGRMRHGGYVRELELAFSPDGKSLVSGGGRAVCIWDAATGKRRWRFRVNAGWDLALAFTPVGLAVASGNKAGAVSVQLLDFASGNICRRVGMEERATVPNLTFSADGKQLAFTQGNTVRLFDPAAGQETLSIPKAGRQAKGIAFAPDGKTIALDDFTDTVRLHDTTTGKCVRELTRHGLKRRDEYVHRLIFSPDGRFLVSFLPPQVLDEMIDRALVRIDRFIAWDPHSGWEIRRLAKTPDPWWTVDLSPDESLLASGDRKGIVHCTPDARSCRRKTTIATLIRPHAASPDQAAEETTAAPVRGAMLLVARP
ncbi:MAG TPA: hypothetical protein VMF69_06140 [Gemmataceae bacterium]|nr:hypothetical protein [Gemmataceae bacterium]